MTNQNNLNSIKKICVKIKKLDKKLNDYEKNSRPKEEDLEKINQLRGEVNNEIQKIHLQWEKKLKIDTVASALDPNFDRNKSSSILSKVVLNLDYLTKSQLKKLTQKDYFFLEILKMWKSFIDSLKLTSKYDIEGGNLGLFKIKKLRIFIFSTYNVVRISRDKSLKALKKIISEEYEKKKFLYQKEMFLCINWWDFYDVISEIKEKIELTKIRIDYEMFPGEFRIQTKSELEELIIEHPEINKFVVDIWKVLSLLKGSNVIKELLFIYKPEKFCAPNNFYKRYRNQNSNRVLFFLILF